MIPKTFLDDTPEDREYARVVLSPWQNARLRFWRWRTNKAFDARDIHPYGSWQWLKANDRLEKRFS